MDLVHGDEIDIEGAKMRQHGAQELRLNLQMMVRLKLALTPGAHMVQHEDGADTCEDWSQQEMRAGKVKRLQSGTNNGVAEQFH